MRSGWILIVEDDHDYREALAASVRRLLRDVDVRATGEGAEALRLVNEDDLGLLITVEESATIDGLVIAALARRQAPDLPVIFLADRAAVAATALDKMNIERVGRRPRLDRLLGLIERMREPPGFTGEMVMESFLEVVRMLSSASSSGALCVRHAGVTGTVWLELGSVVHAISEDWKGVEAFHRMLRWRCGRFAFNKATAPERTISIAAPDLLRECATFLAQDRAMARGSSPGLSALASKHFLKGIELVRSRRFDEALVEWEQAAQLDLGNQSYRKYLTRLREQIIGRK